MVVLERQPAWNWRAGGVFSSPVTTDALRRVGLSETTLARVARPIPAMRLETPGGAVARLTYGAEAGGPPAVGFDRSALDPALEALAREAGATVRRGLTVETVDLDGGRPVLRTRTPEGAGTIECRIAVGADGAHSVVARAAGVATTRVDSPNEFGLSYHLADPRPDAPTDARLRVFDGGYIGIAPVPGRRVNIGIVLGPAWRDRLAGAARPPRPRRSSRQSRHRRRSGDVARRRALRPVAGAAPLGGRVTRRAGLGWSLVGDAVGFLDPFTGEGLHRALVSTELAAAAIRAALDRPERADRAAAAYDRAMQRRFAAKDALSWLVQAFLARPASFEYAARRLATRPDVRATMGLVMGDLVPAGARARPALPRLVARAMSRRDARARPARARTHARRGLCGRP